MDRNRLNIVAGAELFLPSAVICTRKREFAGLADRVAGLIMEDNTMGVRMEDYYNVLNRANRDLK